MWIFEAVLKKSFTILNLYHKCVEELLRKTLVALLQPVCDEDNDKSSCSKVKHSQIDAFLASERLRAKSFERVLKCFRLR